MKNPLPKISAPLWKWVEGRQGTGYSKMLLACAYKPIPFDFYLIRYRKGQGIPTHTDPVPGWRHFRLNMEFIRSGEGGQFECEGKTKKFWRFVLFRSDQCPHSVSPVVSGERYVFSLGWLLK